ncbi:MAG: hypothetical protein P4L40_03575 [Terracidiphilus sp.]|nr:hypothetical protein [Terracidiphilus sp.]
MPIERPSYSDAQLNVLRECPKTITEPPRRDMRLDRGSWRNEMRLTSAGDEDFRVFMRRNDKFPENFSIGLVYLPKDGSGELPLLRCNGPHGVYNGVFEQNDPHYSPHLHTATEETIASGKRPESHAEICAEYASYEEALQYFLRSANILNAMEYFADIAQGNLPFGEGEPIA